MTSVLKTGTGAARKLEYGVFAANSQFSTICSLFDRDSNCHILFQSPIKAEKGLFSSSSPACCGRILIFLLNNNTNDETHSQCSGVNICGDGFNMLQWRKCLPFCIKHYQWIILNENLCILFQILLKFVPQSPTYYKSALVQVRVWPHTGLCHYVN